MPGCSSFGGVLNVEVIVHPLGELYLSTTARCMLGWTVNHRCYFWDFKSPQMLLFSLPQRYAVLILACVLMVFLCSFNHWTRLWWYCLTHQEQPKHNFSVLPVQLWLVKCLQMELDKVWCASWELLLRPVQSKFSLGLLGAVRHARHQGGAQPCRAE